MAGGILLVLAAALLSNSGIEKALRGQATGALSWGPALFRILLAIHGVLLIVLAVVRRHMPVRPPRKVAHVRTGRAVWIAMGAMTVAALALRLWKLDTCLWLDEILTAVDFARPSVGHIVTSFPNQNQNMLYSLLAHASQRIFGESAWALRLPSVLFGVGGIWALFFLGRKVIGTREALLGCVLMTVSYHHIWFSQNARGYTGVLLFAVLSTWLWLEAMERNSWRWWMGYALAVFLGLWIHMTMMFVVAAHGLIWLGASLRERRLDVKAIAAWLLAGSVTLQALALSLPEFLRTGLHEVSMPSAWTSPWWVIAESFRNLRTGFAGAAVVLCGGAMLLAGWLSMWRRQPRAALAMLLPGVIGAAFMLSSGHNLWPRFFFFSMGFALLIAIHGAVVLPQAVLSRAPVMARAGGLALAGLMILASAATVPRCYALPKQDYTGARDFVERNRTAGEGVVVVGLAAHAYGKYYAPQWNIARTPEELASIRRKYTRVALVYTLPIELKAFHPELWRAVESEFEPIKTFPGTLGGGEVYVCRERPHTGTLNLRSGISRP